MPGDRFAFTILVRREQQLVGIGKALFEVGDDLLLPGVDDVIGSKPSLTSTPSAPNRFRCASGTSFARSGRSTNVSHARTDRISAPR